MPRNASFQFLAYFFISASAFPFLDSISGHFNAAYDTLRCYLSHFARIQFITHFNQIITSIILMLQTFLQLKYQGNNDQTKSPFATHPIAMNVAVDSSVVYFLVCAAVLRFPVRCFEHLLVTSGNIAVASLLSVMLPVPDWAAPFVYAIFGLISAAELLLWLLRKLIAEENEAEVWIQRWICRFQINIFRNLGNSSDQWMRMRLQV